MAGNEATPKLLTAKQSTLNSCLSACIGTACGLLASYGIGERIRDKLERLLGDQSITLREAAEAARTFCINFVFELNEHRLPEELVEAVKGEGLVVVGVDAAVLYQDSGRPRRHALLITKPVVSRGPVEDSVQNAYRRKLEIARQFAQGKLVADLDPKRGGKTFTLAEIGEPFSRMEGQYLVVKTKR